MALKKYVLFLNGKKIYTKKLKSGDLGKTFHHNLDLDFTPDGVPKETIHEFDVIPGQAPTPVNQPPVINVKNAVSVLVGTAVTISATITDPDGSIANIEWKQISLEPQVQFTVSEDKKSISFTTLPDTAVYIFEVTATDDDGASTSKQVTVTATIEVPPEPAADLVIGVAGDTDTGNEADTIFGKIAAEKADVYAFTGDTSYDDNDGTGWTDLIDKNGLKEEIILTQGNHEHAEENAEACQADIEQWMPSLKDTPEVNPNEQSWEKTSWLTGKQVKNSYIISLNTQDTDRNFQRNQYNWAVKQLDIAKALKDEGKVDWIIVLVHKAWYTLKSNHAPEVAMRSIYQPLFEQHQVDFVLQGHNHNLQNWLPMTTNAVQLFSKLPSGEFDFAQPHGQFYLVSGAGGHDHHSISEDPAQNPNVFYANDNDYGYHMIYIAGKNATVQTLNMGGTILNTFKVTKGPQEPRPVLNVQFPTSIEELKQGVIDATQSNADTVKTEQTSTGNINFQQDGTNWKWTFTPPAVPDNVRATSYSLGFKSEAKKGTSVTQKSYQITVTKQGTEPPPAGGEVDEFGTKMLYKTTGNKVDMEEGSDHENGKRYNVNHHFENYMMIGYFLTGQGQEKWEMKTSGPNHSGCDSGDECMWVEPQWNIADGSFTLGGEWPHPTNHDIDKSKYIASPPSGSIDKQWIGTAVCDYWNKDGNRVYELWGNKNPFLPDGKPNNAGWVLGLRGIDSASNIILPSKNRPRKIPIDFNNGLEAEIRMHRATSGDTKMKWCRVYEIIPPTT